MTGGIMPAGTDTVIMQEHTEQRGDDVILTAGHKAGQNVRHTGEDLKQGDVVLAPGTKLGPAELGLLASLGVTEVTVKRRLKVAFFSTGDELRSLGEPLEPGMVYDSNRYTLFGMLTRLGVDVIDMGVVRDDPALVRQAFTDAASMGDVIISSGGASAGDADYIRETLGALGQVGFWRIAIRPGRPLAFGRIHDSLFFGLPGNPVAVMVTFYQFVQPALVQMMGDTASSVAPVVRVRCLSPLRKKNRPNRVLSRDSKTGRNRAPRG